jgi:hypothetical protein
LLIFFSQKCFSEDFHSILGKKKQKALIIADKLVIRECYENMVNKNKGVKVLKLETISDKIPNLDDYQVVILGKWPNQMERKSLASFKFSILGISLSVFKDNLIETCKQFSIVVANLINNNYKEENVKPSVFLNSKSKLNEIVVNLDPYPFLNDDLKIELPKASNVQADFAEEQAHENDTKLDSVKAMLAKFNEMKNAVDKFGRELNDEMKKFEDN